MPMAPLYPKTLPSLRIHFFFQIKNQNHRRVYVHYAFWHYRFARVKMYLVEICPHNMRSRSACSCLIQKLSPCKDFSAKYLWRIPHITEYTESFPCINLWGILPLTGALSLIFKGGYILSQLFPADFRATQMEVMECHL